VAAEGKANIVWEISFFLSIITSHNANLCGGVSQTRLARGFGRSRSVGGHYYCHWAYIAEKELLAQILF
jgi:hypothetical protein